MVAYDEMFGADAAFADGPARAVYGELKSWMDAASEEFFDARRRQAELFFRRIGITFAVGGDGGGHRAADPLRHRAARPHQARSGSFARARG